MPPQLHAMWIRLTADKRRFGLLCTSLFVAALLWGRLVFLREVPRTAVADPQKKTALHKSQTLQKDSADDENDAAKTLKVAIRHNLTRDPFILNSKYFPEPVVEETPEEVTPKSPKGTTDEEEEDHPQLRVPDEAKNRFEVVSVIGGKVPVAMIRVKDGGKVKTALVSADSLISGFRVVSVDVDQRVVVVRKDGVNVKLKMLQDDGS
ncbi:MAG TPA: hypothetical protein ENJ06_05345 [Phycisphaeraceae bacterium]|nr:hypothetical protein [Phycisphaeraceae bacterium]